MIFVYGSKFLNKKNIITKEETCEFCGRKTKLSTFTGTKWATIYFIIPLFPMGKKQIFNYCPNCKKYRFLSFKEWSKNSHDLIQKYLSELENNKYPDAAINLMELYILLGKQEESVALISSMEFLFPDNAKILIYIAAWYLKKGNLQKYNDLNEKAYKVDPKNEFLAIKVLEKYCSSDENRNAKTHALKMEEIYNDNINILLYLANWYKNQGMTDDSYRCYSKIYEIDPQNIEAKYNFALKLIKDKDYSQVEDLLLKSDSTMSFNNYNLFTELADSYNKSDCFEKAYDILKIAVKNFKSKINEDKKIKTMIKDLELRFYIKKTILPLDNKIKFAFIIPALLIVYLVVSFGINWYFKNHQKLYITNELSSKSYVKISDKINIIAPANSLQEFTIPEGNYKLSIKLDNQDFVEENIEIKNNIIDRIFRNNIFIVNVYGGSCLLWEEATYSETPDAEHINPYKIYTGDNFFSLHNIDYKFIDFPETIEIKNGSSEKKTGVFVLPVSPEETIDILVKENITEDKIIKYIESQIIGGYINEKIITIYKNYCINNNLKNRFDKFYEKYYFK